MADSVIPNYERQDDQEAHYLALKEAKDSWEAQQAKIRKMTQNPPLDPDDPFDSVLLGMVKTNRAKRRDYAADSDIFSAFRDVAHMVGIPGVGPAEIAYILLLVKVARLRSLRINRRMEDPSNESVLDTYLDLGVYSVIVQALVAEDNEKQEG